MGKLLPVLYKVLSAGEKFMVEIFPIATPLLPIQ